VCTGFGGKCQGKGSLGISRHRWKDNIKMDLPELSCVSMDWIELVQNRDRLHAIVKAVMNLWVP